MKPLPKIFLFGLFVMVTGCVTLYKPNAVHAPMLKEKGELGATASTALSGSGLFNLQTAYALSDHAGLMVDGMYHIKHSKNSDSSAEKLHMAFGEAGAGYFSGFGQEDNLLIQLYGGAGYGVCSDKIYDTSEPAPEADSKYFNFFVQPGVALISNTFDLGFDLRMNYVELFDIHAYLYERFDWWNTDFQFYSDTSLSFLILEPTVTLKGGGNNLKGVLQLGLTVPVIHSQSYFMVNTSSMLGFPLIKFSVGISYTFERKKREPMGEGFIPSGKRKPYRK